MKFAQAIIRNIRLYREFRRTPRSKVKKMIERNKINQDRQLARSWQESINELRSI